MKDWVIIIGFLLILLVLADGIRRKHNERTGKIKVSRSLKKSFKQQIDDEEEPPTEAPSYTSELPNGGARVVGKRDAQTPIPSIEKRANAKSFTEKQRRNELAVAPVARQLREPQHTNLNLGQAVPILMESVEDKKRSLPLGDRIEPGFSELTDEQYLDRELESDNQDDEEVDYEADDSSYNHALDTEPDEAAEFDYEDDYENEPEEDDISLENDAQDDDIADDYEEDDYEDESPPLAASSKNEFSQQPDPEPEEVLIINVMAHKGEMFKGGDLLDIVLQCGMRYGNMDIFHRHSDAKGEGALLFSMANMVKPGTFDLDSIEEFETPGISLFMTLPINADSMQSFDLMADTARAIAETLNGELKDEQRSVMTRQTLDHCRERIRNFERLRLFRRPPR